LFAGGDKQSGRKTQVFIVQCKPQKSEGLKKITTASRNTALEAANDFLDQGMRFVTIAADGCVYTAGEFATATASGVRNPKRHAEDSIESVVDDLLEARYNNPVRVIGFNTEERWSRDVSEDVAHELLQRCADQLREPPEFLQGFLERYEGAKTKA
jgi:hypothetical protein